MRIGRFDVFGKTGSSGRVRAGVVVALLLVSAAGCTSGSDGDAGGDDLPEAPAVPEVPAASDVELDDAAALELDAAVLADAFGGAWAPVAEAAEASPRPDEVSLGGRCDVNFPGDVSASDLDGDDLEWFDTLGIERSTFHDGALDDPASPIVDVKAAVLADAETAAQLLEDGVRISNECPAVLGVEPTIFEESAVEGLEAAWRAAEAGDGAGLTDLVRGRLGNVYLEVGVRNVSADEVVALLVERIGAATA